ncbi:MAG: hypothetical protein AAFX87_21930 [Bacteroidota bacterium]
MSKNTLSRGALFKRIRSGEKKQDIYDQLVESNIPRKQAAKLLVSIPSYQQFRKYSIMNYLLAIALLVIGALTFFMTRNVITTAVFLGLSYVIFQFKVNQYYKAVAVLGLACLSIGIIAAMGDSQGADEFSLFRIIIIYGLFPICFVISLLLSLKLNKGVTEKRQSYYNEEGQLRAYVEYEFDEK